MTTARREPSRDPVDLGQVAYEAYAVYVGWASVHGEQLPGFSEQAPSIQNGWRLAAEAVIAADSLARIGTVTEPDPGPPGTVLEAG